MKKKLLIGSILSLIGLTIGLPAYPATGTASVTVVDSGCTAFTTTVVGTDITLTCSDGPIVEPPPAVDPPVCADITTGTPADSGVIFQGGSVTLSASCTGATSYTWTAGAVAISGATGSQLTATPTGWTVYGVIATNTVGSSAEVLRLVAVLEPTTPPVCTPTATPATITSGQSTQLDAGCDSATGYAWTSSNSETIDQIRSPIVSPTANTTYTLMATNAIGSSQSTVGVTVTLEPVVAGAFSCGPPTVNVESIQHEYDVAGDAFNRRMVNGEGYTMSFTTGPASAQVQTLDIVEWVGSPNLKDVSLSFESCNFESPIARRANVKPNIAFTVGIEVSQSTIRPDLLYTKLEPNTLYWVNLRNTDPHNKNKETCNGLCGMNLKFFGTVP